jgi:hypothetical protein
MLDLLWKCLILGWPVLVRTTETSFEVLALIIEHSIPKPSAVTVLQPTLVMDPATGRLSEEKKKVKLPPVNHYTKMFVS